jgi:uncharacterized caspase-like protein
MKLSTRYLFLSFALCAVLSRAADNPRGMKVVYGESRTALVIGNSAYVANPLLNPMNDAADMAKLLRQRKFEVRLLTNADKQAMEVAIEEFGQRLAQGGVGLFYYAGHAVQIEGVNYLLPVDARPRKAHDVKYQGINVQKVLSEMATSRNRLNVVILDACRDNPYPALSRSLGDGLAKVDAPRGSLIAYATAPGKTAADGDGRNGVFTKNLLKQAAVPGKEVLDMFRDVTAGVARDTDEQQEPWVHTSVRGKFYFTPIDFLDQELELTADELARYKKLLAEQQAADAQMQRLEAEKNASIAGMEKEIEALRRKLNQPGRSDSTLDQLVALGKQREQYQRDLDAAKAKAELERRKREAEMAELRAQEMANRKKKFASAYAKYRWIADSQFMRDEEKQQAWTLICSNWGVTDATDAPGMLFWDDQTGIVSAKPAGPSLGQDLVVDLGGGVNMEFVWIEALKIWVGKYEVTNEQYRRKEAGHESKDYKGHSLDGDSQPVVYVNFDDAKRYAEWLNTQFRSQFPDGFRVRLPSEDEFMTYAQCGDGREYPWGNNWPPRSGQAGNYSDSDSVWKYRIDGYRDGHAVTCNVEDSWANPWGLYGVGGNVWEVCASDSSGGSFGAWRGASWNDNNQAYLRCSCRYVRGPSYRDYSDGFRLVLSR